MYEVVRVEDGNGIVLLVHRKELLKHPLKGKPLALLRRMRARADNGARLLRDLSRIVRTVVRNDIDVVQFLWIVEPLQIFDELPDDRRLVVRGDDNSKRLLRRQDFFLPMPPQTAEADEEKIQRKEQEEDLHRHHNDVKDVCRQIGRECMKDLCHISFPSSASSAQSHG